MKLKSTILPIGLDLGNDSVKMLQLDVSTGLPRVHAAARAGFDHPSKLGQTLRNLLRGGQFAGRSVVAALPRDILHIKNLRLPLIPAAELPGAVRFEARNIFAFDTETARLEFLPAGEVRQGSEVRQEVIVMAARNEDVDPFVQTLHDAGLLVESLDAELCALYRTVERFVRRKQDEQEVTVMVDIGLRRTQVLIGRGREINFFKPIDIGGRRLNDAVSRKLHIEYDEAQALRRRLAEAPRPLTGQPLPHDPVRQAVFDATRSTLEELGRELSLCLRYYSVTFRGQRPARVRLTGGEANDPHLSGLLNGILSLPVEAARPLFSIDSSAMRPADRRGSLSEWCTALGLALKKTDIQFAQKDGRPRALATAGPAEVVDLNQPVMTLPQIAPIPPIPEVAVA
jgi:type IV pilus assembly protein PilM